MTAAMRVSRGAVSIPPSPLCQMEHVVIWRFSTGSGTRRQIDQYPRHGSVETKRMSRRMLRVVCLLPPAGPGDVVLAKRRRQC